MGHPRLAPGPRAHTKLGRPPRLASASASREAEGKEEEGEELGAWERRRGPAGASRPAPARPRARPEARDAAPPPRSPADPALGRRARTRAEKAVRGPFLPQSPPHALPAGPARPRASAPRVCEVGGGWGGGSGGGSCHQGAATTRQGGGARVGAVALRRERSGSSRVLGSPARLTATDPRSAR